MGQKFKNIILLFITAFCLFLIPSNLSLKADDSTVEKTSDLLDEPNYNYSNYGRTLKDDTDINGITKAFEGGIFSTINTVAKFVPGLNIIFQPLSYVVAVVGNNIHDVKDTVNDSKLVSILTVGLGVLGDVFSPKAEESTSAVSFDSVFKTNLYCKYQKVYDEESKYITKQTVTPDNGYPLFPIYPMVKNSSGNIINNKGQCDTDGLVEKYFKNIGTLDASVSKCSYSYSTTRESCLTLPITMLVEYYTQRLVTAAVCVFTGDGNALAKAIEAVVDVAAAAGTFFDSRLALDPVALFGSLQVQLFIDLITTVITSLISVASTGGAAIFTALPCIVTAVTATQAFIYIAEAEIKIIADAVKFNSAKNAMKQITFCGYDWFSYKTTDDGKYYEKGMNQYSRYKQVSDCINDVNVADGGECSNINECTCDATKNNGGDCSNIGKYICDNRGIGNIDHKVWCTDIKPNSKDIRNKIFREYTYGGKEYEAELMEDNVELGDNRYSSIDYDTDYCIDPRLPKYKGFGTVLQRYYMKGNEKANFACNRFHYNGEDGCILPEKDVDMGDRNKLTKITYNTKNNMYINSSVADYNSSALQGSSKKYYYVIDKTNEDLFDKYSPLCKDAFSEARKCCKYRSRHLLCLENRDDSTNNKFCFSNVIKDYSTAKTNESLFTFLKNRDKDQDKVTCEIDYTTKNVIGKNESRTAKFEATKKYGTNLICVFSDNFCPYNFKLNAGLNYRASYCDTDYWTDDYSDDSKYLAREKTHYNAATCKEGLFSSKMRTKYKKNFSTGGKLLGAYVYNKVRQDIESFNDNSNDFTTIYDFSKLKPKGYSGSDRNNYVITKYTEDELNIIQNYGFAKTGDEIFAYNLDTDYAYQIRTSAFGKTKNFCQYKAHCVEVEEERDYYVESNMTSLFLDSSCNGSSAHSRNILQTHNGGVPRQLSAPVVECLFESLKNLINGVAGTSSCADGFGLNASGYCGTDDEKTAKTNLDHYNKVEGTDTYIIKGVTLPDSYNPFLKIQKSFLNIIKISLAIFLVLWGYRQVMSGGDLFGDPKSRGKMLLTLTKYSVVAFLIFSNGWQRGMYDYVVNFSTAGYSFINNLFLKVAKNPKNKVLNVPSSTVYKLKIVEEDFVTNERLDFIACYRYDAIGNIHFKRPNELLGRCDRGYRKKTGETAAEMLVKENPSYPNQPETNLIISNNQEISQLIYFVDSQNSENDSKKLVLQVQESDGTWADSLANSKIWNEQYDGCYFDTTEYDSDKSYLSFFDSFDCKMIGYLGYSTNSSVPKIFLYSLGLLIPQFLFPNVQVLSKIFNAIGSFMFGLMMIFVFAMFNVLIKAVYLFVSSFFTLSILIFISPIVLPMMFFDKTKKYFDTWFEYVLGTVIKPAFGLAVLVLYVNLMDIVLIGDDVIFSKHSARGRGPNIKCPNNDFSFYCIVNDSKEVIDTLVRIFSIGISKVLVNVIIVYLFLKLSDSFLNDLNNIIDRIFKIGSTSSSSQLKTDDMVGKAVGKAMNTGKKIESFRQTYIGDTGVSLMNLGGKGIEALYDYHESKRIKNGESNTRENLMSRRSELEEERNNTTDVARIKQIDKEIGSIDSKISEYDSSNRETEQKRSELNMRKAALETQLSTTTDKKEQNRIKKEIESVDKQLKKTKSKEELNKESIAEAKDKLGVGDGSSGARRDSPAALVTRFSGFLSGAGSSISNAFSDIGKKINKVRDKVVDDRGIISQVIDAAKGVDKYGNKIEDKTKKEEQKNKDEKVNRQNEITEDKIQKVNQTVNSQVDESSDENQESRIQDQEQEQNQEQEQEQEQMQRDEQE